MDRLVITIRPKPSDDGLLRVSDAMLQIIDALELYKAAERTLGSAHEAFEWRLERASTNSPFTVVALAEPANPAVDISEYVKTVSAVVSHGLRNLIERGEPPSWLDNEAVPAIRCLLSRNRNGIGETDIAFGDDEVLSIDPAKAEAGIEALSAITAIDVAADLPERQAFGEIEGVMVAAGRYRNQPAIQIRSDLYGFVWCTLPKTAVEKFGNEHTVREVWEGRTVGVQGRLYYAKGGKLIRVEVVDVREIESAPLIDLDSVLDPDFTAGMDPHEYLSKMHNGELA